MAKFRPRNPTEDLGAYLNEKKAFESGNQIEGVTPPPITPGPPVVPQVQTSIAPTPISAPVATKTPATTINTNPQDYYKVNTGNIGKDGKPVYDIYKKDGQKVSAEEGLTLFQAGLNVEHIGQQGQPAPQPTEQPVKPITPPVQPEQPAGTQPAPQNAPQAGSQAPTGTEQPQAPKIPAPEPITGQYVRYAGSPDVFDSQTGKYISSSQAETIPDLFSKVQDIETPRPDIQSEADFAKKAETNLTTYGSSVTPADFSENPLQAFENSYMQVYQNLGLPSIREEIDNITKQKSDLENKRIEAINAVNDNPWLSEALRSRKVAQINDTYDSKGKVITDTLTLYDNLYQRGTQQVEFITKGALDAFQAQQTFDQTQLDKATLRAIQMAQLDLSRLKEVNGGLYDLKEDKWIVQPKAGGTDGGLTTAQMQTTINQIVGSFDNEQVVKNYNIVSEGYQFAKDLGTKKTPTSSDDQGLIYAFAKAMDPNSVVREGEYATVQKYAQSWAESFGFKAERIFSNTVFLTKEARQNMIDTIKSKFSVSEKNYQNVSKEYQRRIEDVKLGKVGGSITDYSKAFQDNVVEPTGDLPSLSNQEFLQSIPTFGPPTPTQTDNKSFFGGIYNWLTGK